MSREKAGAYHEAEKRLQENIIDNEKKRLEKVQEHFFENKEKLHSKKKFDIFSLRHQLEIGRTLLSLKNELKEAFSEGEISQREYTDSLETLENEKTQKEEKENTPTMTDFPLPFSDSKLAQYFEEKTLGENIGADIVGFLYGFAIQGSTILIILLWRILTDTLLLPKDIIDTINNSQK
ncbi:hypothetical protein KGV55_00520 [Candidatus Gracilibacteria bacterium]|nr:hypothetical protein [Candidatus Gracilibacteria bacterium]